jgi:hypothetical protein
MNRFILFALFFLLMSSLVKAQQFDVDQFRSSNTYGRNHLSIDQIDGSPYLDYEFKVGTVTTDEGVIYKDIPLRYNCFSDVLEFKKDKDVYDMMPKTKIKRAVFGGQVFSYKDYESDRGLSKSFFEILAEGKATLCVRFTVNFYEAEELKGFAEAKPARFDDLSEIYYISVNDSPAKKVTSSKKLVEILADKQKEVDAYIKKQKPSVKKVDDLKKIIAYYNSL